MSSLHEKRVAQKWIKMLKWAILIVFCISLFGTLQLFVASNARSKATGAQSNTLNPPRLRMHKDASTQHEVKGQNNKAGISGKSSNAFGSFGKDEVIRSGIIESIQSASSVLASNPFSNSLNISHLFAYQQQAEVTKNKTFPLISRSNSPTIDTRGRLLFSAGKNIFNRDNYFLFKHSDLCANVSLDKHTQKLVLILIPSEPKNSLRRQIVRSSWLNATRNVSNKYIIKHLFVVGRTSNLSTVALQQQWNVTYELLKFEDSIHDDILLGDFVEDYWNLTYKTMFGVTYAKFFCPNADFVFKIDDDVFVRPEKLVPLIDALPTSNFFGGNCIKKGKPHRNKKSKWYISKEEYPRVRYPPFCYGPSYVFSGDLIPYLFNATLQVNFFKLEDVYMGLCIEYAGKSVQSIAGVSNTSPKYTYCTYKDLTLAHGVEPTKWSMYYRDIARRAPQNIVCPKKVIKKNTRQLR